ncbi:MAG: AMP-binding protein [Pararhodobacter sp.]|nr:AMP-binding protein [Pararhodobacter sp.]
MTSADVPFISVPFIERHLDIETRDDGVLVVRNSTPLRPLEAHLPALFRKAADRNPDRTWLAKRPVPGADWERVSYMQARRAIDGATQALLELSAVGRPLMILSGNSIEHALISMAAMQARMPVAPIAPPYSLRSTDFAKLRGIADLLEPAAVFVQDLALFEAALRIFDPAQVTFICVDGEAEGINAQRFDEMAKRRPSAAVEDSIAQINHDTVAKYMFTSGSTNDSKAVITTQRMLCANIAMSDQAIDLEPDNPPHCTVDWLPWHHVMGGNSVFGMTLVKGGTLYIDGGNPTPQGFAETLQNLREISTSRFANVPVGFAMLTEAMEKDEGLAKTFFRDLIFVGYGGARLADDTYKRFQALSIKHTGRRISFLSGFGATETGPSAMYVYWTTDETGLIGLPLPGCEVKLLPLDEERYEVRVRSPGVTPGYFGRPDLSRAAFDEEGFFKMGDAASFVDRKRPEEGFRFAGRVSEEFKLQSGTFVRTGALRVKALDMLAPLALDAVVTGQDRTFVGLLVWPNVSACRAFLGDNESPVAVLLASPALRAQFAQRLAEYNSANPGSSMRVERIIVMAEPLSMEAGEITDKGYVNQRKALETRRDAVVALYQGPPPAEVIQPSTHSVPAGANQ